MLRRRAGAGGLARLLACQQLQQQRGRALRSAACRCSSSSSAARPLGAQRGDAADDAAPVVAGAGLEPPPTAGREVLVPSHISVRELARRLGKPHTAKRIAATVCLLHRRQKFWLNVEDAGAAVGTPGEMYVFDRLSRVILPHDVASRYATEFAGRSPVWQELEPLHVARVPVRLSGRLASAGAGVQVVVILGHADHGKTTLLDSLRRADGGAEIAGTEVGGITQRVGAWTAALAPKLQATFIDTPGQQLFGNMRRHGACAADVVLLVVAADEGILPQTAESAGLAQELGLPVVVALNKIDAATPEEIAATRKELAELCGGAVVVDTSAITGEGVDALREALAKSALDAADAAAGAAGLEDGAGEDGAEAAATTRKKKPRKKKRRRAARGGLRPGSMALERGGAPASVTALASVVEVVRSGTLGTLLISVMREGTLRIGDWYCCGLLIGKVRTLVDENGQPVTEAVRGTAVAVCGVRKSVIRADPSLVNAQAPLGDALMVLTQDEAEELLEHRQLTQLYHSAALPRGAALPFFADSKDLNPSYAVEPEPEAEDGDAEETDDDEEGGGEELQDLRALADDDDGDSDEVEDGFGAGGMPDDDTQWPWLAPEPELRSIVVKAVNANALDTILELIEAEDPMEYRSSASLAATEERAGDGEWAPVTVVACGVGAVSLSDVAAAAENRCDVWCFAPQDATGLSRSERGGVSGSVGKTAKSSNVRVRSFSLLPELAEALEQWRRVG